MSTKSFVRRPVRPVAATLRRLSIAALALAAGATVLTACGEDSASSAEITMLTHDSFSLPQSVLDKFRTDTGLTLKIVKSGDAGALASTVSLTPGSPKADVVYGIDNTFASRPIDAGALTPYDPPAAADGAAQFAVPDSNHELTAVDRGDVCLNIDNKWFTSHHQQPPTSVRDLRNPAYAAQTALIDPGTSSPGMAFLLATIGMFGNDWKSYWQAVNAGGASIVSGWEIAYNQLFSAGEGKGPKPIVLSYASSPAATPGTSALLDGCFRQVEYVGILKGTKNESGARKAVDFMLSPDVQRALPSSMYVYPVQKNTPLPDGWAQQAPLPQWTVSMPPKYIADNRESWLEQWRAAVGR
ncbi:thiamine ABC transporter substrate-binding protein [Gordonia sp. DT30]|uniref:thiamine ABC transporter substrate-binding protein n=1 Tax=unclassified Gordonia (in: high G+C Gram-positive bacteria) TaxID=2657482 RepID=UPI003CED98A1